MRSEFTELRELIFRQYGMLLSALSATPSKGEANLYDLLNSKRVDGLVGAVPPAVPGGADYAWTDRVDKLKSLALSQGFQNKGDGLAPILQQIVDLAGKIEKNGWRGEYDRSLGLGPDPGDRQKDVREESDVREEKRTRDDRADDPWGSKSDSSGDKKKDGGSKDDPWGSSGGGSNERRHDEDHREKRSKRRSQNTSDLAERPSWVLAGYVFAAAFPAAALVGALGFFAAYQRALGYVNETTRHDWDEMLHPIGVANRETGSYLAFLSLAGLVLWLASAIWIAKDRKALGDRAPLWPAWTVVLIPVITAATGWLFARISPVQSPVGNALQAVSILALWIGSLIFHLTRTQFRPAGDETWHRRFRNLPWVTAISLIAFGLWMKNIGLSTDHEDSRLSEISSKYANNEDESGQSLLDYVIENYDGPSLQSKAHRLLLDGASASGTDKDKTPLLSLVCQKGDLPLIKEFLEKGADPNAKDKNGNSPLHVAAVAGDSEMVAALLDKKADAALKNSDGETPLLALCKAMTTPSKTLEVIRILLKADSGGRLAEDKNHFVPLYYAQDRETAELLFKQELVDRAQGWAKSETNAETPLHEAAAQGRADVVQYLLDKGFPYNAKGGSGKTPLELATGNAAAPVLEAFAANQVAAPNLNGLTADAARSTLEGVGLRLGVAVVMDKTSTEPAGTTIRQTPEAGAALRKGDTVQITVSAAVPPDLRAFTPGDFHLDPHGFNIVGTDSRGDGRTWHILTGPGTARVIVEYEEKAVESPNENIDHAENSVKNGPEYRNVLTVHDTLFQGHPAATLEFYDFQGETKIREDTEVLQKSMRLHKKIVSFQIGTNAYRLILFASPKDWDEQVSTFNKIADSFKSDLESTGEPE